MNTFENTTLSWEEQTQYNIGFDATIFNNISINADYFNKSVDGLLFTDIRFGQIGFDDNAPYMWKYKLTETKGILQAEKIDFKPKGAMMSKALGELFERLKGN